MVGAITTCVTRPTCSSWTGSPKTVFHTPRIARVQALPDRCRASRSLVVPFQLGTQLVTIENLQSLGLRGGSITAAAVH